MPKQTFPAVVRKKLFTDVDDHNARKQEFLSNPERDFTRCRKLSLYNMIKVVFTVCRVDTDDIFQICTLISDQSTDLML